MGSVRKVTPSIRTSMVECPIHVTLGLCMIARTSYGTRRAAPDRGTRELQALRAKKGRATDRPPRSGGPMVFMNWSPLRGAPAAAIAGRKTERRRNLNHVGTVES